MSEPLNGGLAWATSTGSAVDRHGEYAAACLELFAQRVDGFNLSDTQPRSVANLNAALAAAVADDYGVRLDVEPGADAAAQEAAQQTFEGRRAAARSGLIGQLTTEYVTGLALLDDEATHVRQLLAQGPTDENMLALAVAGVLPATVLLNAQIPVGPDDMLDLLMGDPGDPTHQALFEQWWAQASPAERAELGRLTAELLAEEGYSPEVVATLAPVLGVAGTDPDFAPAFTEALGPDGARELLNVLSDAVIAGQGDPTALEDAKEMLSSYNTALLTGLSAFEEEAMQEFVDALIDGGSQEGNIALTALTLGEAGDGSVHGYALVYAPELSWPGPHQALVMLVLGVEHFDQTNSEWRSHVAQEADPEYIARFLTTSTDEEAVETLLYVLTSPEDYAYESNPEMNELAGKVLDELRASDDPEAAEVLDTMLTRLAEMSEAENGDGLAQVLTDYYTRHPEDLHDLLTTTRSGIDDNEFLAKLIAAFDKVPETEQTELMDSLVAYQLEHDPDNLATNIGTFMGVLDVVGEDREDFGLSDVLWRSAEAAGASLPVIGPAAEHGVGIVASIFGAASDDPGALADLGMQSQTDAENFELGLAIAMQQDPEAAAAFAADLPPDATPADLAALIAANNTEGSEHYALLNAAWQYQDEIADRRDQVAD
jgi:hypothetical protein